MRDVYNAHLFINTIVRTNIDIDDTLMEAAMRAGPYSTKREAVEAGLQLLARKAAYRDIRASRQIAMGRQPFVSRRHRYFIKHRAHRPQAGAACRTPTQHPLPENHRKESAQQVILVDSRCGLTSSGADRPPPLSNSLNYSTKLPRLSPSQTSRCLKCFAAFVMSMTMWPPIA